MRLWPQALQLFWRFPLDLTAAVPQVQPIPWCRWEGSEGVAAPPRHPRARAWLFAAVPTRAAPWRRSAPDGTEIARAGREAESGFWRRLLAVRCSFQLLQCGPVSTGSWP